MSCRIDDDAALQQKVTEALSVYDDYVKNKESGSTAPAPEGSESPAPVNGEAATEAPKEEEAAAVADKA